MSYYRALLIHCAVRIVGGALRRLDNTKGAYFFIDFSLPHVDFVAEDILSPRTRQQSNIRRHLRLYLGGGLFRRELRYRVKGPEALYLFLAGFDPVRVKDFFTEHLVAAADAQYRLPALASFEDSIGHSGLSQVSEVGDGALGAGEDDKVGVPHLEALRDVADGDAFLLPAGRSRR